MDLIGQHVDRVNAMSALARCDRMKPTAGNYLQRAAYFLIIRPMGEGTTTLSGDADRCGHDVASSPALSSLRSRIRPPPGGRGSVSAAVGVFVDRCARRAGPREHGRQAARSKRDRPERAGEQDDRLSHVPRRRRRRA
jgi:hypothetical protein